MARPVVDVQLDHLRALRPLLITEQGELIELDYTEHPVLGLGDPARRFTTDRRRLQPGELLLLLSDGVLERRRHDGEPFGLDGVRGAIADAVDGAAASTVRVREDAITAASADPPAGRRDDRRVRAYQPRVASNDTLCVST